MPSSSLSSASPLKVKYTADHKKEQGELFVDAALSNRLDEVNGLIEDKIDVNYVSERFGMSAISVAAYKGHEEVVHKLITAGADLNSLDPDIE